MKRNVLLILLLLYGCISFAAIYMEKQKSGEVVYSDTPSSNSQPLSVPNVLNTSPSFQQPPAPPVNSTRSIPNGTEATNANEDEKTNYTLFQITSPQNEASIQNQTGFTVTLNIEPELNKNDKVQLMLDNKLYGTPQHTTSISVGQVDRGTHQLFALLLDESGKVIKKSNSITIYFHRVSTNFRPQ